MKKTEWSKQDAENVYRLKRWSNGYFEVSSEGHISVNPKHDDPNLQINMLDVVEEMQAANIQFPAVIRFLDILRSQVEVLNNTFRDAIELLDYKGRYIGVYPVKVNQMREVVEEVIDAGARFDYGLEAGSKPELLAALAYNTNKNSLTILNGYKDDEYLRLGMLGRKMGRKIVVVIEKFSELESLLKIAKEMDVEPIIGLRVRMMVKGRGKWENSSGERAKFGLGIAEIVNAVKLLKEREMIHCVKLLHFHIGSQLTDIRAVKEAVQEASLLYAKLIQMDVPLEYVDVGGGLAVDYDGSQSTSDSSRNYSIDEYVADIVYGFKQTCDLQSVPHPNLVSESGRAITAYHSCVVTQIIGEINPSSVAYNTTKLSGEHVLISNMRDALADLEQRDNVQEVFNDIKQLKEQAIGAFNLGILSLDEMAKMDTLYWQTMNQIEQKLAGMSFVPEELQEIGETLSSQYLCNFSVFQSAVDSWAIDQVLPIVPLSRLNERPTKLCSLVDITCDSDGKIDKFAGDQEVVSHLPLHQLRSGEDYFIGIFLTGAYQDVMGDMHNLFGRLNEVHVFSFDDDPKDFYIEEVVYGSTKEEVLSTMQYTPKIMAQMIKNEIDAEIARGKILPRDGVNLIDYYEACLGGYTYLKTN